MGRAHSPWGAKLGVSRPNQLRPVRRTGWSAASRICAPLVCSQPVVGPVPLLDDDEVLDVELLDDDVLEADVLEEDALVEDDAVDVELLDDEEAPEELLDEAPPSPRLPPLPPPPAGRSAPHPAAPTRAAVKRTERIGRKDRLMVGLLEGRRGGAPGPRPPVAAPGPGRFPGNFRSLRSAGSRPLRSCRSPPMFRLGMLTMIFISESVGLLS
jgi:hypothetical protein